MAEYTLEEFVELERAEGSLGRRYHLECSGCMYKAECVFRVPSSRAPCMPYRQAVGTLIGRNPWNVHPVQWRGW